MRVGKALFSGVLIFISLSLAADPGLIKRKDAQSFIHEMSKQYNFQPTTLKKILLEAKFRPEIIASMEKPFEKKDWDTYKNLFLTPARVQAGLNFWQNNQKILQQAEKLYNVPASIIVAILGVETLYGKHQGTYRVIDALTTLAFYYPKRKAFFTKELKEYLLLCREQGVNPNTYYGSYAGAIGLPQFMPSSYRYYAVNFTNDPKKDLINDNEAVIASVANYFHQNGWRPDEIIALPAQIRGNKIKHINTRAKKALYDPKILARSGVIPTPHPIVQPNKAGVISLNTAKGQEFWVTYPNFYVITRYNSSPQYALVVYLFARQLQNQWAAANMILRQSVKT